MNALSLDHKLPDIYIHTLNLCVPGGSCTSALQTWPSDHCSVGARPKSQAPSASSPPTTLMVLPNLTWAHNAHAYNLRIHDCIVLPNSHPTGLVFGSQEREPLLPGAERKLHVSLFHCTRTWRVTLMRNVQQSSLQTSRLITCACGA